MTPLEKCRSCSTPIRWVTTAAGKQMPLDPDPCPDGNFVFQDPAQREVGPVRALSKAERDGPADRYRYKSHFATCRHARTWTKGATRRAVDRAVARVQTSAKEG